MSKIDLTRGLYTFKYERIFMKKIVKMMAVLGLLSGLFAVVATRTPEVKVEAATVATKRVWMKNSITSTWDADGAGTAIHYWGGSQGTDWPGVRVSWDPANELVYFDLPADVTTYMFVRVRLVVQAQFWIGGQKQKI